MYLSVLHACLLLWELFVSVSKQWSGLIHWGKFACVIGNDCLRGQYCSMKRLSYAVSFLTITHFLIAFSAAAADHNSPIPQGLHHRPTREYYNPLRGEGEASPQVGMCDFAFIVLLLRSQVWIQPPPVKFQLKVSSDGKKYIYIYNLQEIYFKSSGLFKLFRKWRSYFTAAHADFN